MKNDNNNRKWKQQHIDGELWKIERQECEMNTEKAEKGRERERESESSVQNVYLYSMCEHVKHENRADFGCKFPITAPTSFNYAPHSARNCHKATNLWIPKHSHTFAHTQRDIRYRSFHFILILLTRSHSYFRSPNGAPQAPGIHFLNHRFFFPQLDATNFYLWSLAFSISLPF